MKAGAAGIREQLSGTWKLASWKIEDADGTVSDSPYGPNPTAWIMYHPNGQMCAMVMRPDRVTFASASAFGGTPDEIKAAFESYAGYCGTYDLNERDGSITHHLKISWFPNWVGTDQTRFFEIASDRLTLFTPPITGFGGTPQVHRLVWERMR